MITAEERTRLQQHVAETRRAQGLPPFVEDPTAIERAAVLLGLTPVPVKRKKRAR